MENHNILQFFEREIVDQTEITYRKKNHNIDLIQFSDANLIQYDELNVFKEKIKRATGIAIKTQEVTGAKMTGNTFIIFVNSGSDNYFSHLRPIIKEFFPKNYLRDLSAKIVENNGCLMERKLEAHLITSSILIVDYRHSKNSDATCIKRFFLFSLGLFKYKSSPIFSRQGNTLSLNLCEGFLLGIIYGDTDHFRKYREYIRKPNHYEDMDFNRGGEICGHLLQ